MYNSLMSSDVERAANVHNGHSHSLSHSLKSAILNPSASQKRVLAIISLESLAVIILWQFWLGRYLIYPFELVSVAFHEFGHAFMAILTGGTVLGISVSVDEGGLTRFVGGSRCLVLPAGYIGSSIVGSILLLLGFTVKLSKFASIAVDVVLFIVFFFADSMFTRFLVIFQLTLLIFVYFYQDGRFCQYFVLLMGVVASLCSMLAMMTDLIFREIEGSDAYRFSESCTANLLPSVLLGVVWLIFSGIIMGLILLLGLILFRVDGHVDRESEKKSGGYLTGLIEYFELK